MALQMERHLAGENVFAFFFFFVARDPVSLRELKDREEQIKRKMSRMS